MKPSTTADHRDDAEEAGVVRRLERELHDERTRGLIAVLWVFVLFNILFRDFHELFNAETFAELEAGVVNGTVVTEQLMLAGGVLVEIPVLMPVIARAAPRMLARWMSIVVAPVTLLIALQSGLGDLDDWFFLAMEALALVAVAAVALRWRSSRHS